MTDSPLSSPRPECPSCGSPVSLYKNLFGQRICIAIGCMWRGEAPSDADGGTPQDTVDFSDDVRSKSQFAQESGQSGTLIDNEREWLAAFREYRDHGGSASALRAFLTNANAAQGFGAPTTPEETA